MKVSSFTYSAHWAAFLIIDQFLHHHHHKSRLQVSTSIFPFLGFNFSGIIPLEYAIPRFIQLLVHPKGYLDFYIRTKNIRRAPFYILSVGNAVLMIVVMILHDLCDSGKGCSHTFTKVDYLRSPL